MINPGCPNPNGCEVTNRLEYKDGTSNMEVKFVGIDVSKPPLDFDCSDRAPQQFGKDEEGIAALVGLLEGSGVECKDGWSEAQSIKMVWQYG